MVTVPIKPGKLDEVVDYWRANVGPSAREFKGYVSARMLADHAGNRVRSIGIWETEADYQATVAWTKEHLSKIADRFAGPPVIEGFDLAVELT
jgi:heme-degrading monooxygenase HmoA